MSSKRNRNEADLQKSTGNIRVASPPIGCDFRISFDEPLSIYPVVHDFKVPFDSDHSL